jgi:hypothetical protein
VCLLCPRLRLRSAAHQGSPSATNKTKRQPVLRGLHLDAKPRQTTTTSETQPRSELETAGEACACMAASACDTADCIWTRAPCYSIFSEYSSVQNYSVSSLAMTVHSNRSSLRRNNRVISLALIDASTSSQQEHVHCQRPKLFSRSSAEGVVFSSMWKLHLICLFAIYGRSSVTSLFHLLFQTFL